MSLEKIIDEQIRRAMENGEFDNLKNAGKPLDFSAYLSAPEDMRVGLELLKSNDFIPEEVELMREIGQLKEQLN